MAEENVEKQEEPQEELDIQEIAENLDTSDVEVDRENLVIETRDLHKRYGKLHAVKSLSLRVPRGSIFGFVGPNGAGKTSTMRILTTLMLPTSGEAFVNGFSCTARTARCAPLHRLHARFLRRL